MDKDTFRRALGKIGIRKTNKGTFRCIFGEHKYSKKETRDKEGLRVHMCIHCNLHGYSKNRFGDRHIEYYPNGYPKREVYSDGYEKIYYPDGKLKREVYKNGGEIHYNKRGVLIYRKYADGTEKWRHKGRWYSYKPKKWNPENG